MKILSEIRESMIGMLHGTDLHGKRNRSSEKYFQTLVQTSPDAIVIVDREGVISFASKKTYEMLGVLDSQPLIGTSILSWFAPDTGESVKTRLQQILYGQWNMEYRQHMLSRRDGTTFWCEIVSSPMKDRSGFPTEILLACRDISERKRTVDALRESEERFARLSEATFEGIALTSDGIVIDLNDQLAKMFGYSSSEMIGTTVTKFVAPDSVPLVIENMQSQNEGPYEHLALRNDGTEFPVEVRARSIPYLGRKIRVTVIRDISADKQAVNALRLQSTALQTAANSIVITDSTGRIIYVNSAFSRITGYSAEEALGENPRILKSGKQSNEFYQNMWVTISAGKVWTGELINRRKDGSFYPEEMTVTPVLNELQEITHFIAIKNDITDRKRLQDQLAQAQKLEAIGTLAGGIAHDFNNILGIILAHVSLINGSLDAKTLAGRVEVVRKTVQRGANLVHQILAFARKTEVDMQPVEMNGIIQEVTRMLDEAFPKNIEIVKDLYDANLIVLGDHSQLVQAILNLCINARDAMESGSGPTGRHGRLTMRTGKVLGNELLGKFSDASASEYISVTIADTGMGLDPETKTKIFEPFFTTKSEGKGTGLGLAVVYGVVKAHRGLIDVDSQVGKGTAFSLYIPASAAMPDPVSTERQETGDDLKGTETILVVEDEDGLREFIVHILERNGYRVLTSKDGLGAIAQFEYRRKEIDLVILDMGLPKLNGEEVLREFKLREPNVKVIPTSGYLEPELKLSLLKLGAMSFLEKPYTTEVVLRKIREALAAP